ncbi:MAG: hypothetical protein KJO79_08080 [Verrucomicrobiae bacterium]|nr:hypothetical protein [Verrucomicrobiae bacterium]NNJ87123.1 hypothetical protein [Akkermansiaceae bacterium]
MNSSLKTFLLALLMALIMAAPILLADNGTGMSQLPESIPAPDSDRISNAELKKRMALIKGRFDGAQWSAKPPQTTPAAYNIYKDSIILQQGKFHTLLPKNAIIFLPDSLQEKITRKADGVFLPWPQFYLKNRSWIFTYQVNLKQATGSTPIKKSVREQFAKINRAVIALHQNNPISVRPTTPLKP